MQYTPNELFVGALENVSSCAGSHDEQEIWPKFMVMILLRGKQRFVIDGVTFDIDGGSESAPSPVVFMLNVARYARLTFLGDSEVPLRKVMISAPLPWINRLFATLSDDKTSLLRGFFSEHLAHFSFEPGHHILQVAEKIVAPAYEFENELHALYLRAQANEIMLHSLMTMLSDQTNGASRTPQRMGRRQFERIRDFIAANLDAELTIDMIAREAGASASTVQRNFKEHSGVTIFDFIRHERLEAARLALAKEGIPVSHAAHLARYSTIPAFTTAFRKAFGVTPKQVRA